VLDNGRGRVNDGAVHVEEEAIKGEFHRRSRKLQLVLWNASHLDVAVAVWIVGTTTNAQIERLKMADESKIFRPAAY